jgi:HEAT repeat protein
LGQAKTREALDTLIQVATGQASAELKPFAIKAIRAAGGLWGDGTFHEELSPALERVWRESNDEELLLSVSAAIAKIGAPGGIELLLSSVRATNSPESSRSRAVQLALAEVINPRAVPPLAAMLGSQPPTGAPGIMAGSALVAIGDAAASKALIDWIRDADASAAGSVRAYVLRTRHPAMLQAWESALDSTVVFRSEANRDAIRSGLDEFHRNRPTNP